MSIDVDKELIEFGERLRRARVGKNLTQRDLSDAVGAAKGSIPNYEAGKTPRPIDNRLVDKPIRNHRKK